MAFIIQTYICLPWLYLDVTGLLTSYNAHTIFATWFTEGVLSVPENSGELKSVFCSLTGCTTDGFYTFFFFFKHTLGQSLFKVILGK